MDFFLITTFSAGHICTCFYEYILVLKLICYIFCKIWWLLKCLLFFFLPQHINIWHAWCMYLKFTIKHFIFFLYFPMTNDNNLYNLRLYRNKNILMHSHYYNYSHPMQYNWSDLQKPSSQNYEIYGDAQNLRFQTTMVTQIQ